MRLPRGIYPLLYPFLAVLYLRGFLQRYGQLKRLLAEEKWRVLCIFPSYQTGGAEKVHTAILKAIRDLDPLTIIAHKSKDETFKAGMRAHSAGFVDFHKYGDNTIYAWFIRRMIVRCVNQSSRPVTLFSSNTGLFYQVLPQIGRPGVKKVDLLHAFSPYGNGIEDKSIPCVPLLDLRIVINRKTIADFRAQYQAYHLAESYLQRIKEIGNAAPEGIRPRVRMPGASYKCLFVARGSAEKRPWIYGRVATACAKRGLPVSFSSIGDNEGLVSPEDRPHIRFYGSMSEEEKVLAVFDEHDFLITCSEYEGFPMTIMEGLSGGIINISVDVGGIAEHLNNVNSVLLPAEGKSEAQLVADFCTAIQELVDHPREIPTLSEAAIRYASGRFSYQHFKQQYIHALTPDL